METGHYGIRKEHKITPNKVNPADRCAPADFFVRFLEIIESVIMDKQQLQYSVNKEVKRYIPEHAWESTVAIVIVHNQGVYQFGSGILLRIADESFVVTAGHVIKEAYKYNKTLGITATNESFIAVPGEWSCSSEGQYNIDNDPFDVAIYNIPQDEVHKLDGRIFLHLSDIDFELQPKTTVYTLFGYPEVWSKPSTSCSEKLHLKPFQYTTISFDRDTRYLAYYQERFHILLDAQLEYSTTDEGTQATFKDIKGNSAPFPQGLGGISGCSVWRIGDLDVPFEDWPQRQPKIVAVQTGVYHSSQAIVATRWIAVSTLIHEAFPKLRPAMDLLWPY